jgi:hypothetical protein
VTWISLFKGVGGLIGENKGGSIVNSFATGSVQGTAKINMFSGGLVGANSGVIQGCFATGSVLGEVSTGAFFPSYLYVGGLVVSQHEWNWSQTLFATGLISGKMGTEAGNIAV